MAAPASPRRGIKDVFYETRVLAGRDFTIRRFAAEMLGGAVEPVMLGYIEKGTRFPSEALVRRLAAIRKQDAHELLAVLWRDRMLHAFGKELRRVMQAPRAVTGVEDAELAVVVSQAIAALPDDASWIPVAQWRRDLRRAPTTRGPRGAKAAAAAGDAARKGRDELARRVETTLVERGIAEIRAGKVRRQGRHFVATDLRERQSLAIEYCALFAKGLLDKLALPQTDTGTYLRNHYLNIEESRLADFQSRLDAALTGLAREFAADPSPKTSLLNVLVTSTKF